MPVLPRSSRSLTADYPLCVIYHSFVSPDTSDYPSNLYLFLRRVLSVCTRRGCFLQDFSKRGSFFFIYMQCKDTPVYTDDGGSKDVTPSRATGPDGRHKTRDIFQTTKPTSSYFCFLLFSFDRVLFLHSAIFFRASSISMATITCFYYVV